MLNLKNLKNGQKLIEFFFKLIKIDLVCIFFVATKFIAFPKRYTRMVKKNKKKTRSNKKKNIIE